MAGGRFTLDPGPADDYGGKLTASVIVTCLMAASGGLIFGYDIGISGGVTAMESFLKQFFPGILRRMAAAESDEYCVYDSQLLTAFTSSLYVAGLVASLAAGRLTRAVGRQKVMLLGGATFFVGSIINAAAVNVEMLILGRILLGFGVGFTNQATPVYLAETAPARWRGAFTAGFQLFIAVGVVVANLTNYGASHVRAWGWRLSLGLAAVPAAAIFFFSLLIPDTPSSLVARGRIDDAREALRRVRGGDADAELKAVERAVRDAAEMAQGAFRRIATRRYRPYLVMAVAIPLFQQLTGVIVIAFFSPVLFRTVGFGSDTALISAVILGVVNLLSLLVSSIVVDRYGRKLLFMTGGAQMILSQVAVAWILGAAGRAALPRGHAVAVLVLLCTYAAGFGWSWGPLSWIVPGEIFPVEVRSAGQSISVAVNLGVTFLQAQVFLAMLCRLKAGTFVFYASWVSVMTAFVAVFLPETKGVPLEAMPALWARHWYWRRFLVINDVIEQNYEALSS
ncbi:sugar transport protein MST1-like isoform X1 [Curcuma longa]|uniref:sugar transport protein MST1-like isoform X1 n=1 Tax=Curcuma longa TaxID=136217 RepID=UPI003D9DD6EB